MTTEEQVDVLICGSGSAGLCAAMWLARCGVSYRILERSTGPLKNGKADGIQCRTVEIFESFGMGEELLKEACHILEVAFWGAADDGRGGIRRSHVVPDLERGLSHHPHLILNQARVNGLMLEDIARRAGAVDIVYGADVQDVSVDAAAGDASPNTYCVTTRATMVADGSSRVIRSKYVLACDGAHSAVRKALGAHMVGDSTDVVWGVMDVYARTSFPDIRKKALLHSARDGSLMIIPREGELVRFYIEQGSGAAPADVTLAALTAKAQAIFQPYTLDIAETAWWSAYTIGQRLADAFRDPAGRVFLTGDACHTHSPKAGQGMNVSLQDGYNMGWKLAAVLQHRMPPAVLDTYVSERRQTAHDLITFDRAFARLFSSAYRDAHGITPDMFQAEFVRAGRYTAGQSTHYAPSLLVDSDTGPAAASPATALTVGMRFPSAQVVRFCDARPMHLVCALPAEAQWHIVVFAGDIMQPAAADRLSKTAAALATMIERFTPTDADADSVIQAVLVLSSHRASVEQEQIPELFTPTTGKWNLKNLRKTFVDEESYSAGHGHAYDAYGIRPDAGCLVVVRPDHYISMVTTLNDVPKVATFFDNCLLPTR